MLLDDDGVRANIQAWHSDLKATINEGFAIYPEHNLHMLLYAAAYDGQGAISTRAAKDYAKLTNDTSFEVMTLIRFGRFDEVADVKSRPVPPIQGALWDFAQGYAHLKRGEVDFANLYLQRVKKTADTSKAMLFRPGSTSASCRSWTPYERTPAATKTRSPPVQRKNLPRSSRTAPR